MKRVWILLFAALVTACSTQERSVGICEGLTVQEASGAVSATCWTKEEMLLEVLENPKYLGPVASTWPQLLAIFPDSNGRPAPPKSAESIVQSGYNYRQERVAVVQGRVQYRIGIQMPAPVGVSALDERLGFLVKHLSGRYPDLAGADLALVTLSDSNPRSVVFRFSRWSLASLEIDRYVVD